MSETKGARRLGRAMQTRLPGARVWTSYQGQGGYRLEIPAQAAHELQLVGDDVTGRRELAAWLKRELSTPVVVHEVSPEVHRGRIALTVEMHPNGRRRPR